MSADNAQCERSVMPSPARPLRLYTPADLVAGASVSLSDDQARYVLQVMRRTSGDPIHVFNGRDGEWHGGLVVSGKKSAQVNLEAQTRDQYEDPDVALFFAPLKRTAIDLLTQKATELGVAFLCPVTTARTNSDRVNTDRLTAIAIEAAEQCERLTVPRIQPPDTLTAVIENWPKDRTLYVLDETGEGTPIADVLQETQNQSASNAAFVIGPEGGFTDSELDLLRGLPFSRAVSLGPRILRAETAALAALTCWQALRGDWTNAT